MDSYLSFGKERHLKSNIAALELLFLLETEDRYATSTEQEVLAKYSGWGGLKEILLDPNNDNDWKTASDISLRPIVANVYSAIEKLDKDGKLGLLRSAQRSIINAHFTPFPIINAIYDGLQKAGFAFGNILEPSAGIGNFLAAMPIDMANRSEVTAIEMDPMTGMILRRLFPTVESKIAPLEKTRLQENHYDLVISNVPFGDTSIYDPQLEAQPDKGFSKAANNLHNYFFAKSILSTRPGGLIALITSRFTLDGTQSNDVRELMNDKCEFLGALRLPDTAFKANAGTEVVADIILLRKLKAGEAAEQNHAFQEVRWVPFTDYTGKTAIIGYNEYFHDNPSNMLGTVAFGGLYNKDGFNLVNNNANDIGQQLVDAFDNMFQAPVYRPRVIQQHSTAPDNRTIKNFISLGDYDSIGNIVKMDASTFGIITGDNYLDPIIQEKARQAGVALHQLREGIPDESDRLWMGKNGLAHSDFNQKLIEQIKLSRAEMEKMPLIIKLRETLKEVIFREADGWTGATLEDKRATLRETYNAFTSRFGHLTNKENDKVLGLDADGILVQSVERKDPITKAVITSDILHRPTIKPAQELSSTDNVRDAIMLSLKRKGHLDINLVCELLDKPYEAVMAAQIGDKAEIFIDAYGNHVPREDFLSGNILQKIKAEEANLEVMQASGVPEAELSRMENNIIQLKKVLPTPIMATDIYSPLHARWLPQADIAAFINATIKTEHFGLSFSGSLDEYKLNIRLENAHSDAFKTQRRKAEWVFNHALNGIEPIVNYTDSEGRQVFDAEDTHLAKEKYRAIRNLWDDWKYNDPERRERLGNIYNEKFNNTVLRKFDFGDFQFPGLLGYKPLKHQTETVFRNTQTFGGINDHMVGAGKTLVQVMTAMEIRRLQTANKPLIIGLKSQVPQLYEQFRRAYPLAKVLFPTEKDFSKENRQRLLNNIATNDWDCIILSHDQFNMIPQPLAIQKKLIEELTDIIRFEISDQKGGDKQALKSLQSRLYNYEQKLERLKDAKKDTNVLDFSRLGIDYLMVDESQEYKNLEFITRKRNVRGLGNPAGSKKAFNLLIACRHLQDFHNGDKGILFCSGTPISNSMAELYLLFKYLRPNKLKELGLETFDRWAANFANDYSDMEYYMGKFKEVHRFREFANLPELITMYREIADVRNDSNLVLEKPKAKHQLVKIQPSHEQLGLIEALQRYIETKGNENAEMLGLTAGFDSRRGINPSFAILAVNFARKLSLDPRLIGPTYGAGSKIEMAGENIAMIYSGTGHFKGTQLVFCDIGTPKGSNVLDNLHSYLEGDTPQSDLFEIFGGDYHEMAKKPLLETVKGKVASVLGLTVEETESLLAEANTRENFSVYDELKNVLVKKAIPADQVVFIHDYKTRKQKDALYAAVNRGDVRIVLGSTKKLGTGVNVQERLAALHHLDISWRPSDMEQRNGRGERQGNWAAKNHLGNSIDCFYYATERTLDASMYNTVSLKSKFIAQIKTTSNTAIRTVKDIEEDVDMGGMAAELSGDPIFKERATLQKKIGDLERSNRAFLQNRYNLEDRLKRENTLLDHYRKRITALEKAIPLLGFIPKDPSGDNIIKGTVGKTTYSKLGEFGRAILEEAMYAKKYMVAGKPFELGSMWGFKVFGEITGFGEKEISRYVVTPSGEKIGSEKLLPEGEMAVALQVREIILTMPSELKHVRQALAVSKDNIVEYGKQLTADNPHAKDLESSRSRMDEVNKIIKERSKVENGKKEENGVKRQAA